jgi:hypothetical protein
VTLENALRKLLELYEAQCCVGEPHCRLTSGIGDEQRIVVVVEENDEPCFECRREQYGTWDECPMPMYRDDWEVEVTQ